MEKRKTIFNCIICNSFSYQIICTKCQKEFLNPKIRKKDNVISFYDYETIEFLIKYKYHKFGSSVFKILAENSLKKFALNVSEFFYVIPIDDKVKKGYSHTAILAHSMKTKYLKVLYNVLLSTNNVQYAGKSLEYRLQNPRNFKYSGKKNIDVILVDDIQTTGITLNEAEEKLKEYGVKVYLKVVLANLKN
jgi:competence protein ComFC